MNPIRIAISPGELLDRISILQLKAEYAMNSTQRAALQRELDELLAHRTTLPAIPELSALAEELAAINRRLWEAEDQLRLCEKRGEFGPGFVALARSIYQNNDRRSALRGRINQLLAADWHEVKIYASSNSRNEPRPLPARF